MIETKTKSAEEIAAEMKAEAELMLRIVHLLLEG